MTVMSAENKPQRRWFQFSLRTLLIVVMAAAGLAGAWHIAVEPYRQQREAMAVITDLGGTYKSQEAPRWIRYLDKNAQDVFLVDLDGSRITDDGLKRIVGLSRLQILF